MIRSFSGFAVLLVLIFGSPLRLSAQTHVARIRQHRLTFTVMPSVPSPGALDSFVVVAPKAGGATVVLAYDNPCQVKPRGTYKVRGDTLSLVLWNWPAVAKGAQCSGIYQPTAFEAQVNRLPAGHYMLRVAFRHVTGFRSKQPSVQEIQVQ